jgi:transposase-like protein
MKDTKTPSLTLIQIIDNFPTDDAARAELERIRWKSGIVCPHCQCKDPAKFSEIAANPAKKIRAGLRWCSNCEKQFTVTIGTIFEDSHIPLRKWLIAWYLVCSSKKGISSLQLQRVLELGSYRTALFMAHRIRFALKDSGFSGDKLDGTVEMDECYIGGKKKGMGRRYTGNKTPVVSLVQRDGKARSQVMGCVTGHNLKRMLHTNVETSAKIYTDQHKAYPSATKGYRSHKAVNHGIGEYVRGDVHTNTVEGFFSLLKRGVMGTFHHVSAKHLPLYLAEFDHRYNCRDLTDGERTVQGIAKAEGKRLRYAG